jgi:ActR/RegA family two-component response regulator
MDDRRARHVVVVDDDPAFRRFVARALEGNGFRVTLAEGFASRSRLSNRIRQLIC